MPGATFLGGDSITLRTIETEDVEFLHEMINNPDLWHGFGAPTPRSRDDVRQRIETQDADVALLICRDDDPVGRVRLVDLDEDWANTELTCYVAPTAQRQGFATEACRLVIEYGFDYLPVNKIFVRVFEGNEASHGLAETLGFVHEGTLRNHVYHDGRYVDLHYYGLLETDWRSTDD